MTWQCGCHLFLKQHICCKLYANVCVGVEILTAAAIFQSTTDSTHTVARKMSVHVPGLKALFWCFSQIGCFSVAHIHVCKCVTRVWTAALLHRGLDSSLSWRGKMNSKLYQESWEQNVSVTGCHLMFNIRWVDEVNRQQNCVKIRKCMFHGPGLHEIPEI